MEDVLEVYARPYNPRRPVVCVDEKSKELHSELSTRQPLPPKPCKSTDRALRARQDYEYKREGTANIFMMVEPLAGKRWVRVTDRRTKQDFAEQLRIMVDEHYPDAEVEVIVLVVDNLNTHGPWVLYEAFSPEEASRIAERIEWHYTPEHGSWLNIAEIELSVLQLQCLNRRIPDKDMLTLETGTWEQSRNNAYTTVRWHFTTADARIKLRRLYPVQSKTLAI